MPTLTEQSHSWDSFNPIMLGGTPGVTRHHLVLLRPNKHFHAKVRFMQLGDVQLRGIQHSFPMRSTLQLLDNWCLLNFFHGADTPGWINGSRLSPGTAFVTAPGTVQEALLGENGSFTGLLFGVERLRDRFGMQAVRAMQEAQPFRPIGEAGERVRRQFERLRSRLLDRDSEAIPEPIDDIIEAYLQAQASSLGHTSGQTPGQLWPEHYQLVRAAEKYLYAHMRMDLSMQDLCEVTGSGERSLRYAFSQVLGVSPLAYFSRLRLSWARRELMLTDAEHSSVHKVAARLGFWNLSRFAEYYRTLYGELPSETLVRPRAEWLARDPSFPLSKAS